MDIDVARKLISKHVTGHGDFLRRNEIAKRYYETKNDILFREKPKDEINPMRNADNRIAMGFYPLLVDQKTAYMFTAPPVFDLHDETLNKLVADTLGDGYKAKCQELATRASNAGIGWIHYWGEDGKFQWAVVPSEQVIPIWDTKLNSRLMAVLRVYRQTDDETGDIYDIYEYWTETQCEAFKKKSEFTIDEGLEWCPMFTDFYEAGESDAANVYPHGFGEVPFIPFKNNILCKSELERVKELIDSYDKTYSGFMNDLEDIQEVIFILTNYGGEDLNKFLKDLKYYKAIQTEAISGDDKSGVSTLTIQIPVEARDKMLEITRKAIFTMGQGVDPSQQGLDKTSGEAMKFVYSLLELKAGQTETYFSIGFNQLIRAILHFAGRETDNITQTWTRTSIKNDSDLVSMCANSVGIVSQKTNLSHHPFVEDVEEEIKQIEKEKKEQEEEMNPYGAGVVGFKDSNKQEGGEQ